MPKPVFYHANAIIYFQGDKAEGISILKQGKVELSYEDLQTGSEIREPIQTGEFFGVKAALGNNPHDETALAVSDSTVVIFSVSEFEDLVSGNPRVLMKMLQVFSTQLRRIHNQVQSLLSSDRAGTSQEAGLFAVGEYYLKEQQYAQASHAFRSCLTYWPQGLYASQAAVKAEDAEAAHTAAAENGDFDSDGRDQYELMSPPEIDNYYKLGEYKEAMKGFLTLIKDDRAAEHRSYAEYRVGCCLYHLERYNDAMTQLASVIRKYPKHPNLGEVVWYMGLCHEASGDNEKAQGFVRKAEKIVPEGSTLHREIVRKLREIGGDIS